MLLLPFLSSVGYAVAALALKRSLHFGIGPWRCTFICNVIAGLIFLPMLALEGPAPDWANLWQPVVTAILFLAGQILTFQAFSRGDVSIAAPVLGLKSLIIAAVTAVFLREPIPAGWWIAAVLSVFAILLMNDPSHAQAVKIRNTALIALASAFCFAMVDVTVQIWTPRWGPGRFIPIMFASLAILSGVLVPRFSQPLRQIPPEGWRWLLGGGTLLAIQGLGMAWSIGVHGHATAMNIVYSARGVWIVVLVWFAGKWFSSEEQHHDRKTLLRRMAGALLLVAAIALL